MMGKVNFVLGHTTDVSVENECISTFAKDLVRFANETQQKVQEFSQKLDDVLGKDRLVQGANKVTDKIVDIINQFVMVSSQRHELSTMSCLVSNLGLFLLLINVQVNVASVVLFAIFSHSFHSCQNVKKLGSVAVSVGNCLRFQETHFANVETNVVESAEIMYRIGGLVNANDDVQGAFQRLKCSITSAMLESAKSDEMVNETFTDIKTTLISPGRRKLVIQVAAILGGFLGFFCSIFITWFFSWLVVFITILIGTTSFAILGAILGLKIVNRRETNLLEDLVKCSNQRDYLQKKFENVKYKLQNSELYVKYAHHDEDQETGRPTLFCDGQGILLNDFTEC